MNKDQWSMKNERWRIEPSTLKSKLGSSLVDHCSQHNQHNPTDLIQDVAPPQSFGKHTHQDYKTSGEGLIQNQNAASKTHQKPQNNKTDADPDSSDQTSLHLGLRGDQGQPVGDQPRYDILAHGPSHRGPRTLLVSDTGLWESSWRCLGQWKNSSRPAKTWPIFCFVLF